MKKIIYIVLLVLVIIVVAFLVYLSMGSDNVVKNNNESETIGAQIVWVEGSVEYKQGDSEWKRASASVNLKEGDSVETLADGRAIINFDDGSAVRLDNKSKIILASLKPDHMIVKNENGQVYSRVVKSSRIFDVQAGDVLYESLGTTYTTINKEEQKGVEVYESKVKVIDENKNEIIVEEGNKYLLENKDDAAIENKLVEISKADLEDAFIVWNKEEDNKILDSENETDTNSINSEESKQPATTEPKITLSAVKVDSGLKFTWIVDGVNVDQGFKLVRSATINPVYPGNDYQYLTNKDQRTYTWAIKDGKTYYFRICQYLGGKCGVYSNNVKITAPLVETIENPTGSVSSITLSAAGGSKVSWTTKGISKQGFKLVWSKNSGPTYPCRDGDKYNYYSDANTASGSIDAFSGEEDYYVRVCEYLGGKCGVYSNQIKITLGTAATNAVKSITLSSSGSTVNWTVNGYSKNGFKVVWSKNSGPTYPCRDGDKYNYLSDPSASTSSLDVFNGAGTYYVRVCEYLGGACGVYSNQITVALE